MLTIERPVSEMSDHERICAITTSIKAADKDLRQRFPILKNQSALGVAFFVAAAGVVITSSVLYVTGILPGWACIIINAVFLAVIREIEHDLIHNLYFPTHQRLQNLLMAAVWPFLGNLPHPWYRRKMHLLHHRTSGHDEDFEEQLIGNGLKFGPLKILAMLEPGLASLFRKKEFAQIPFYNGREFFKALVPVGVIYLIAWYGAVLGFATATIAGWLGFELPTMAQNFLEVLGVVAVVWLLPNVVRQVSLQIISSNMHYFGDVENRLQETQVFNAWWMFPLNLVTCNFGITHCIHHFMVSQPFYLRQMVSGTAHAAFQKFGIRYNDTASILRGNRYQRA